MQESEIREIADELGLSAHQVQQVVAKLLEKGIVTYSDPAQKSSTIDQLAEEFSAAKQSIQRRDIYAAAREARQHSHRLFEDQGLASLSLVVANLLADLIEEPDRILEMAS